MSRPAKEEDPFISTDPQKLMPALLPGVAKDVLNFQRMASHLCSVASGLACPEARECLASVVRDLRALDTSWNSAGKKTATHTRTKGTPYKGKIVVRSLCLSGLLRNNDRLREVHF